MSLPVPAWVLTVLLEDDLLAFNRAVGIVRRRNLAIASVSLGPSSRLGVAQLTWVVTGDRAAVDRLGDQLRKMVGAHEVTVASEADCVTREHALIRVRALPAWLGELLDTAALYQATVVEEGHEEVVLEVTAPPPLLLALLRALEPYGVLEVARSGTIALARPEHAGRAGRGSPMVAAAIPA